MLSNWMSICLYQYLKVGVGQAGVERGAPALSPTHVHLPGPPSGRGRPTEAEPATSLQDSAGEPLYKLFKAIKHQVEKGPVDAVHKKAKYTLNDTGLLGDDVEYAPLVSPGAGPARWWDWAEGSGPGLDASPTPPPVPPTPVLAHPGPRGAQGHRALTLASERGSTCDDPEPAAFRGLGTPGVAGGEPPCARGGRCVVSCPLLCPAEPGRAVTSRAGHPGCSRDQGTPTSPSSSCVLADGERDRPG